MKMNEFMDKLQQDQALKAALEADNPQNVQGLLAFAKKQGVELADDELEQVAGGIVTGGETEQTVHYYHNKCGGELLGFLGTTYCNKCSEWHWTLKNFTNGVTKVTIPRRNGPNVLEPRPEGYLPK